MNRHTSRDGSPQTWATDDHDLLDALDAFELPDNDKRSADNPFRFHNKQRERLQ